MLKAADHVPTWFGAPWPDVLTGIGTVALAVVTVGALVVTVHISKREITAARSDAADERDRVEAEAEAERERRRQAAHLAASQEVAARLARQIGKAWPKIAVDPTGALGRLQRLNLDLVLDTPALADTELASRVRAVQGQLAELVSYRMVIPADDETPIDEGLDRAKMLHSATMYVLALGHRVAWVRDSLTAHRTGQPLPVEPTSRVSVLPTLHGV